MRYRKGSIVISETHDVPLLLLVRNAGYITHEQLIALSGYDKSQSSVCNFLWRIRRLLVGGFVALLQRKIDGHKVYSITRKGLAELESFGHMLSSLNPETTSIGQPSKMTHYLELNEIRLTLKRHRLLDSWLSDIEVCSENLLTEDRYVKDYDALAMLRVGDRQLQCAIEYERTTKSLARYAEIRQALSQEQTLNAILYIVREVERLFLVAEQLTGAHPGILFVTASAFLRFGRDAYAMRSLSVGGTLEELLVQLASEAHPVEIPSPHNWPVP